MGVLKKASVLPVAFGGAALSGSSGGYGFGSIKPEDSKKALLYCFDRGIRIFDTAPVYGFGESERRIGQAFKNQREKIFIISKSGVSWHPNKRINMTNDPKTTQTMFEQSLRDLQSDYIDLYMIHWPDESVDIRRPMEILHKLKTKGKILHIGLCNTNEEDLSKASEIDRIEVVQSEFNFFTGQDEKLMGRVKKEDIDFISWGTLDKGIITGRVTQKRTFEESDCRSHAPWWKQSNKDQKIEFVEKKLHPLLKEKGYLGLSFALGYNLSLPEISHCLCGGKTVEDWEEIFQALDHLPSPEIIKECVDLKTSQGLA